MRCAAHDQRQSANRKRRNTHTALRQCSLDQATATVDGINKERCEEIDAKKKENTHGSGSGAVRWCCDVFAELAADGRVKGNEIVGESGKESATES